ncbi:MAG TPA: hypothetical protein VIT68_04250 [Candidatus Gracilibacteria bacterium]
MQYPLFFRRTFQALMLFFLLGMTWLPLASAQSTSGPISVKNATQWILQQGERPRPIQYNTSIRTSPIVQTNTVQSNTVQSKNTNWIDPLQEKLANFCHFVSDLRKTFANNEDFSQIQKDAIDARIWDDTNWVNEHRARKNKIPNQEALALLQDLEKREKSYQAILDGMLATTKNTPDQALTDTMIQDEAFSGRMRALLNELETSGMDVSHYRNLNANIRNRVRQVRNVLESNPDRMDLLRAQQKATDISKIKAELVRFLEQEHNHTPHLNIRESLLWVIRGDQ